jgi:predicted metal-dependent phosphoesterase TrpH
MIQKFDLHCHSTFSDGIATIEEIEVHCMKNNLGVALTDHNEIRGAVKLIENGKIPSIPGMEVSMMGGLELLIYFNNIEEMELFYKKQIEPYKKKCLIAYLQNDLFQILENASELETYTSIPHPYAILQILAMRRLKRRYPPLLEYLFNKIDAIEVFNGNLSEMQNQKAQKLRQKYNKGMTLGSDAHDLKYFGYTSNFFQTNGSSYKEFFRALKENRYKSIRYVENKLRFIPIFKSLKTNMLHYLKCKFFSI